ncbi:MAG TPA: hypothetical protein VFF52_27440 [Isosphaeraceae bacterium]|nr:hypothetical protein [Isosphaeraceae bacterium]
MSAEAPSPLDGNTGATAEEAALAEVLESYLAQLEAGAPADPERLIADHPELARPLRTCLKVMHLARDLDESAGPAFHRHPVPFWSDSETLVTTPPLDSSALLALPPSKPAARWSRSTSGLTFSAWARSCARS